MALFRINRAVYSACVSQGIGNAVIGTSWPVGMHEDISFLFWREVLDDVMCGSSSAWLGWRCMVYREVGDDWVVVGAELTGNADGRVGERGGEDVISLCVGVSGNIEVAG